MKVRIVDNKSGHKLQLGTEFDTQIVDHNLKAVSYVWNKEHGLDWWILPVDYEVLPKAIETTAQA